MHIVAFHLITISLLSCITIKSAVEAFHMNIKYEERSIFVRRMNIWASNPTTNDNPSTENISEDDEIPDVPKLDGNRIFPVPLLFKTLRDAKVKVAGVYAVFNNAYFSSTELSDGWEHCEWISKSNNIAASLECHVENEVPSQCAFVKVNACETTEMETEINAWRRLVPQQKLLEMDANGWIVEEEEDEEEGIISPFSKDGTLQSSSSDEFLPLTMKNVDLVLEEVRPYLISDGGNVSLEKIDSDNNIYLIMEGACGSCPSSTVTMKMGIERVLREKFSDLGQVLQVTQEEETLLTEALVQKEIDRIAPAINAMGGKVEIRNVDPEFGSVTVMFRGPNQIKMGIDLAIRDLKLVNHVEFVMD